MSATWRAEAEPAIPRPDARGWLRILRRGLPMLILTFGGLAVLLLLRLPERALAAGRPVSGGRAGGGGMLSPFRRSAD